MSTAPIGRPGRRVFSKAAPVLVALIQSLVLAPGPVRAAPIAWRCDYGEALRESASRRLPVIVVIGARWCRYCRKMQAETFCNPAVAARIADHFVPLLIDADQQGELVEKFKVSALPTVVVISPERMIVARYPGFQSASRLNQHLARYTNTTAKPPSSPPARPTVEAGKARTTSRGR